MLREDKLFQDQEAARLGKSSTVAKAQAVSKHPAFKDNMISGLDAQNSLRLNRLVEKESELISTAVKLTQELLDKTMKDLKIDD